MAYSSEMYEMVNKGLTATRCQMARLRLELELEQRQSRVEGGGAYACLDDVEFGTRPWAPR